MAGDVGQGWVCVCVCMSIKCWRFGAGFYAGKLGWTRRCVLILRDSHFLAQKKKICQDSGEETAD